MFAIFFKDKQVSETHDKWWGALVEANQQDAIDMVSGTTFVLKSGYELRKVEE